MVFCAGHAHRVPGRVRRSGSQSCEIKFANHRRKLENKEIAAMTRLQHLGESQHSHSHKRNLSDRKGEHSRGSCPNGGAALSEVHPDSSF
jgi:hypothetical protein